jgi:DNA end-binding protein Ku
VPVWFALDESRPLVAFAGIWTNWTSVRKAKEGEVNADIFGFLTCEPNAEVKRVHPKAMPANREHIIALEPIKGLVGTLLRYPYEVRSEQEYFDEIQDVKVTKNMLDLAKHIVNQKSGSFEPEKFEETRPR